jgi:hypothetical protein
MCTTTAFRPRARMHGSSWEPGGGLLVALDHQGRRGGGVVTELLRYRRRIGVYVRAAGVGAGPEGVVQELREMLAAHPPLDLEAGRAAAAFVKG